MQSQSCPSVCLCADGSHSASTYYSTLYSLVSRLSAPIITPSRYARRSRRSARLAGRAAICFILSTLRFSLVPAFPRAPLESQKGWLPSRARYRLARIRVHSSAQMSIFLDAVGASCVLLEEKYPLRLFHETLRAKNKRVKLGNVMSKSNRHNLLHEKDTHLFPIHLIIFVHIMWQEFWQIGSVYCMKATSTCKYKILVNQ